MNTARTDEQLLRKKIRRGLVFLEGLKGKSASDKVVALYKKLKSVRRKEQAVVEHAKRLSGAKRARYLTKYSRNVEIEMYEHELAKLARNA